jgi:lipoyl(octanoyl) transferase
VDEVERMEEPGTPRVDARAVPPRTRTLRARWLGRIGYRDAWALQRALAAARADGTLDEDQILLLEHDAVLTLGRNADAGHVIAPGPLLRARGIELIRVERGGEVTYHGPGQLVAYPIVLLVPQGPGRAAQGRDPSAEVTRPLGVRAFVEALEAAMADTCAAAGIPAGPRAGHPGCWVDPSGPLPRKIGALGIRVARGVTFHGIALNVATDLADFDLIDPCGMPGLHSTSLTRERARSGRSGPDADSGPGEHASATTAGVADSAAAFAASLARRLGVELVGHLPPRADPARERRALEALVERLGTGDDADVARDDRSTDPAPTLARAR